VHYIEMIALVIDSVPQKLSLDIKLKLTLNVSFQLQSWFVHKILPDGLQKTIL